MNEETFQRKLAELIAEIGTLPAGERDKLELLAEETRERHRQLKETVHSLQESIDFVRLRRDSELELRDMLPREQRPKQIGSDRFKLMTWPGYELTAGPYEKFYKVPAPAIHRMGAPAPLLWRTILSQKPYPITAMISWESNPLMWAANTKMVYDAMMSPNLELYVVNEYWMTPTALMADYVLPVASWMERSYLDTIEDFADFAIGGEKAVEPLGERKEDYYLWQGLGRRLV